MAILVYKFKLLLYNVCKINYIVLGYAKGLTPIAWLEKGVGFWQK